MTEVVWRRNKVVLACLVELATNATLEVMKKNGLEMEGGRNRQAVAEGAAAHFNGHISTRLGVA